jgi:hypothetical protein
MQEEIIKEEGNAKKLIEEFENKVSSGVIFDEEGNDITCELFNFILSAVSQAKEEGRKQGVEEYKKELREKVKHIFNNSWGYGKDKLKIKYLNLI